MSLFPIFKVNIVTGKGKTDKILVFYGNTLEDKIKIADINVLFQKSPIDDKFKNIFNAQEIAIIREQSISVVFVEQSIHIDDNIGVVKLKIFEAMQREVSMDELYLFCLKQERLNPITVYQNLTQNDRLPLTRIRLNQILLNIWCYLHHINHRLVSFRNTLLLKFEYYIAVIETLFYRYESYVITLDLEYILYLDS